MCCSFSRHFFLLLLVLSIAVGAGFATGPFEDEFDKPTIDIGVVVSDIDASSRFYSEAIGFTNTSSFDVPGDFAKKSGLTDSRPLEIQVFQLGEGEGATSLKLMEVAGSDSKKVDHSYIDSSLGFSYLTIYVKSTTAASQRLEKAGVKPVAEGPVAIEGTDLFLTIVRDPDGNLIELIGPK